MASITQTEYGSFQEAYDFFNRRLFQGKLPECLITLNRKAKARGYFWSQKFAERSEDSKNVKHTDEIALNPDCFVGREDRDILSTLVHEMTHLEQAHFGKPPRKAYHDKAWGKLMKAVGLHPSSTGQPGGKETGQNMTHYIVEEGPYDLAYRDLSGQGFKLRWQSLPNPPSEAKPKSKVKFSCECGLNVWAKPGVRVACAECSELTDEIVVMKSEDDEEAELKAA